MKNALICLLLISNIAMSKNKLLSHKKIKKEILSQVQDLETTCLDELIQRKRQLNISSLSFGLSPIAAPAATGAAGAGIGVLASIGGGLTAGEGALYGVAFGAFAGYQIMAPLAVVGASAVAINTVKSRKNKILLNLIVEARAGRAGKGLKLFKNKQLADLDDDAILQEIAHLDETGQLCNGDLVGSRFFGKRDKLKFKIPRLNELRQHFVQ